jgi:3-hydroxyisobutyrate dehydrogenase
MTYSADTTRVGFMGLGRLGGPIATNLATDGYAVTGFDPDPAARARMESSAVRVTPEASQCAASSQVLITCLRGSDDVHATLDLLSRAGSLVGIEALLDLSTISPGDSESLARRLGEEGVSYLRVTVSGSAQAAAARQISLMCSGDHEHYKRCAPILDSVGRSHMWLGPEEEAKAAKVAVNMLVGVGLASLIESVRLAEGMGIDRQKFLDVLAKTPALVNRDYTPAASLALMVKDLELAAAVSADVGTTLPLTDLTRALYAACDAQGWAERDFACLDELYDQPDKLPGAGE